MSEVLPGSHTAATTESAAEQPFDWEATKLELLERLRASNDPRSFLEYLLRFPSEHMETEYWDDYLVWIYDHADEILELARRKIPDIADEVIMVLTDTHAFIEERSGGFEEYGYKEKGAQLRSKILDFCKENLQLFWVNDAADPYRLGLRLPALSKVVWLCGRERKTILLRQMMHGAAVEAIKRGFTAEDRREDAPLAYTDLDFDIDTAVEDIVFDEEIEEVAQAVADRTGTSFDLRKQRLKKATKQEKSRAHHKHLREWVSAVLLLEGYAPGAAKELQDRFGIVNFNHYPIEMLKRQYDLRNADIPYGVLVGTQYDWNDAFSNYYVTSETLKDFSTQVAEHGSHVRIVEVDSSRALGRQCLLLEKQYGGTHKISFALVRAHGGEEEVQLGNRFGETLSKKLLGRLDHENLRRFFIEHPNIIFDSCSVGAYGGLVEAIASVLQGTAQGAEDVSRGIKRIDVSGEGEQLSFAVTLNEGKDVSIYSTS